MGLKENLKLPPKPRKNHSGWGRLAKKLMTLINRTPGYQAVLTRDADRFVTLRNRVKKAREAEADIFVSLHADSFHKSYVKGASVYALSLSGASSEAARWIARKENASDLLFGDVSLAVEDEMVTLPFVLAISTPSPEFPVAVMFDP